MNYTSTEQIQTILLVIISIQNGTDLYDFDIIGEPRDIYILVHRRMYIHSREIAIPQLHIKDLCTHQFGYSIPNGHWQ